MCPQAPNPNGGTGGRGAANTAVKKKGAALVVWVMGGDCQLQAGEKLVYAFGVSVVFL